MPRAKKEQPKPTETLGERVEIPSMGFLSSGCTLMDLAIANQLPGGFPCGKISHIYGLESTAKTVFVQEPLGDAQRKGGMAGFIDAEETFDFDRAELFGVKVPADPYKDTDYWRYRCSDATMKDGKIKSFEPVTIESLFETHLLQMAHACNPKVPNACAIDSLSSLTSMAEMAEKLGKGTYGTSRAKQMSAAFRKYIGVFGKANLALLFIDQSRMDIGQMSYQGPQETISGGKALKFYSSVRIHMSHEGKIKNKRGVIIGVRFGFEVVKNKIAPPFREGSLNLLFDYGIDDVGTNVEWIQDQTGNADKSTLRCKDCGREVIVNAEVKAKDKDCPDCGGPMAKLRSAGGVEILGEKFNSVSEAIQFVETNRFERELQKEVERLWHEANRVDERAAKRRE